MILNAIKKLEIANLKLTTQRVSIIKLLFAEGYNHYTPEQIHKKVLGLGLRISLATIYNSLKQFTKLGIIKEIRVSSEKIYYDTNCKSHHHFYDKTTNEIHDIDLNKIKVGNIPILPDGKKLETVEVLITIS